MTISKKHEAIAEQYFREKDQIKIYHYTDSVSEKPDIKYIKKWLQQRGYDNLSDLLNDEDVF
jgi:hypothetical protein